MDSTAPGMIMEARRDNAPRTARWRITVPKGVSEMRSRIALVIAAALAVSAMAGCRAVTPPPYPVPTPTSPVTVTPTPTPEPATDTPAPAGAPVRFTIYFAYNEKMQPAPRTAPAGTKAVLRAAIEELLDGPTATERKDGLFTAVPTGTKLRSVTINSNVAVIDLSDEFDSGGGTLSMTTRLAQMVFTATQFPTVKAVTFKIEGKTVKVFGGEGIIIDKPQTRKSFEDSSPAVLLEQPAWRGTLAQGAVIRGTANVFEASLQMQVRDAVGKVVMSRTVQATAGTGTRGTWRVTAALGNAKAGIGSVRVFVYSAKDGSPTDVVTVPVVLIP